MTELEEITKKYPNINLPTICPLCGSRLAINKSWTRISCPNKNCYTYAHSRITKYLDRMGVMHIAGSIVDTLMDNGLLTDIPDLYIIDWNEVSKIDGFGKTSTNKYKKEIDSHREVPLAQFLSGFNIAGMGEKQIGKMIGDMDLDEILNATYDDFIGYGIAEITAKKFEQGLNQLRDVIKETSKYITFVDDETVEPTSNKLGGKSFCFTGKIDGHTRNELENMVIENGGIVSSVKKGLSYLVTDDTNSNSSKNVKAKELGIPTITSVEFLKLLK